MKMRERRSPDGRARQLVPVEGGPTYMQISCRLGCQPDHLLDGTRCYLRSRRHVRWRTPRKHENAASRGHQTAGLDNLSPQRAAQPTCGSHVGWAVSPTIYSTAQAGYSRNRRYVRIHHASVKMQPAEGRLRGSASGSLSHRNGRGLG